MIGEYLNFRVSHFRPQNNQNYPDTSIYIIPRHNHNLHNVSRETKRQRAGIFTQVAITTTLLSLDRGRCSGVTVVMATRPVTS